MREINAGWKNFIGYAVRYVLIIAAITITPLVAASIAPLFDWCILSWSEYGQLRGFFTELFTAIFWLLEMVGGYFLFRYLRKKSIGNAKETVPDEKPTEKRPFFARLKGLFDKLMASRAPLLPLKKVWILLGITAFCILLVTLQIGFQVKPFYELGEKVTYSQIVNKTGEWIKNAVKCVWILIVLRMGLSAFENIPVGAKINEKRKAWLQWLGAGVLLLVFGVVDVLMTANEFALIYLVFYVAFTAVYYFAEQSVVKSFLLILFIYLF